MQVQFMHIANLINTNPVVNTAINPNAYPNKTITNPCFNLIQSYSITINTNAYSNKTDTTKRNSSPICQQLPS